jgi:hypothetical protein
MNNNIRFSENERIVYQEEKGEMIIKRIEHRGTGRKIASWLVAGPIGYLLIGRDKTKKKSVKGLLTITNKAIYCSVNSCPFDQIIAITKERGKKLMMVLDKSMTDSSHVTVTLYLKSKHYKKLFIALENARTSHLLRVTTPLPILQHQPELEDESEEEELELEDDLYRSSDISK